MIPAREFKACCSRDEGRCFPFHAWERLLSRHPLMYLADCKPHGECDPRVDRGRHLWSSEDLDRFNEIIEARTQASLEYQQAVFRHWQRAATLIQAHARGLIGRRRVRRMGQVLHEASQAAVRARVQAAMRRRQLDAVILIQTVYHRHCDHLRYISACRSRLQRSTRLYLFRRQRDQAAIVIQRAFRQYWRRVRLRMARRAVVRLLRLSRQRQELEALAAIFQKARYEEVERERLRLWSAHPEKMAQAKRVWEWKQQIRGTTNSKPAFNAPLPRLRRPPKAEPNSRHPMRGVNRHSTTLPRIGDCQ